MNEKITKLELIKRVVDLLKCKGKKYTQEDVENMITAFLDIVIEAVSNGDSVNLNGYITIGTKYMSQRKSRNVIENQELIVPEHYRVDLKAGSKLKRAVADFTQKRLGGKYA